jgi:hypothetical protein
MPLDLRRNKSVNTSLERLPSHLSFRQKRLPTTKHPMNGGLFLHEVTTASTAHIYSEINRASERADALVRNVID